MLAVVINPALPLFFAIACLLMKEGIFSDAIVIIRGKINNVAKTAKNFEKRFCGGVR